VVNNSQSYLFNIVNLDENEPEYSIRFYAGDILSVPADILFVSAYKGCYYPLEGTILGCLFRKYGINLENEKLSEISENLKLYNIKTNNIPFKKIVLVEMIGYHTYDRRNLILLIFDEVKRNISKIIDKSNVSISIPLIGTGVQGLAKEIVAVELLKLAKSFVNTAIREMNIFAYDFESISLLNININQFLNRNSIDAINIELLSAIIEELKIIASGNNSKGLGLEVQRFLQLLTAPKISLESIATFGRKLCELFVDILLNENGLNIVENAKLEDRIKTITPILLKSKTPFLLSYLRLLQSCGNVAAHNINTNLSLHDIVAISISVIRIYQCLPQVSKD
jgi:hypothetical protein